MKANRMIVKERSRDIGKFKVSRLLPVPEKRQVGPFTFIDHMGPVETGNGKYMDVDQHPHIGISTLTYLFEGEIEHRDSLRTVQLVTPGDVGFMTAGRGITHTERTPADLRSNKIFTAHGYQIWIALPKELEEMEPQFEFVPKSALPVKQENGLKIILVAGSGFGMKSPLKVWSPLFMAEVKATDKASLNIDEGLQGELALVVVSGKVFTMNETISHGEMLISTAHDDSLINIEPGSHILLLGGKSFPEERFLLWNFVSSSRERLEQAKAQWQGRNFPKVPGDATYVPFP